MLTPFLVSSLTLPSPQLIRALPCHQPGCCTHGDVACPVGQHIVQCITFTSSKHALVDCGTKSGHMSSQLGPTWDQLVLSWQGMDRFIRAIDSLVSNMP